MNDASNDGVETVHSFAPIIDDNCEVIILGTIPSRKSVAKDEYYADPRNQFWRIIASTSLFGIDSKAPYPKRLERLKKNRVALWDALESCKRKKGSSSDSEIIEGTEKGNDFQELFNKYKNIRFVFFSSRKAANYFKKLVRKRLVRIEPPFISGTALPSTSANNRANIDKKIEDWSKWLQVINMTPDELKAAIAKTKEQIDELKCQIAEANDKKVRRRLLRRLKELQYLQL